MELFDKPYEAHKRRIEKEEATGDSFTVFMQDDRYVLQRLPKVGDEVSYVKEGETFESVIANITHNWAKITLENGSTFYRAAINIWRERKLQESPELIYNRGDEES